MALAHDVALTPDDSLWRAWNWDLLTLVPLVLLSWLYARGVRHLWRRLGRRVIQPWRVTCFAGGCATLFIAVISPFHELAHALFWVHMIQHMLIMGIVAPLLVLGRPPIALLWALSPRARLRAGAWTRATGLQASWRLLTGPSAAWTIHLLVLWGWHAPLLYDAAMRSPTLHWFEHTTMLAAAYIYWHALIAGSAVRAWGYGAGALASLGTLTHAGMLGALLTFAPVPLYESHVASAAAWGLTPLEDQQLAGLVMWVPACMVYLVAGLLFIGFALRDLERRHTPRQQAAWPQRPTSPQRNE